MTTFEAHAGRGSRRSGFDHVYLVNPDGSYGRTLREVVNACTGPDGPLEFQAPRVVAGARVHAGSMRGGRARRTKVPAILQPRGERVSSGREALLRNDQQVMWAMEVDGLAFSEDDHDSGAHLHSVNSCWRVLRYATSCACFGCRRWHSSRVSWSVCCDWKCVYLRSCRADYRRMSCIRFSGSLRRFAEMPAAKDGAEPALWPATTHAAGSRR